MTANADRAAAGYPELPAADWVLVKGYHDSGTINGVFGPYTEAYIDWLLSTLLEFTTDNWTKVRLQSGPEETAAQRLERLA